MAALRTTLMGTTIKRTTILIGVATTALAALAGCSGGSDDAPPSIRETAEEMILTDVAAQAGLGELSPVCPEVPTIAVGTTWQCTATTTDQRVVAVEAVINQDGRVELATTNMIAGPALPSFERAAVQALNNTVGSRLTEDAIDCGDSPVVFGSAERVMVCGLVDPDTRDTYDVSLTISDIEARQFTLVVAGEPRG